MKTYILLAIMSVAVIPARAQHKKSYLSAGIDMAAPVYTATGDMRGMLTGIFIKNEWRWGKRFAGTISAGYVHFEGSINHFASGKLQDFAIVPVLAGLRYYPWNNYYAALETGYSIRAHENAATRFTLAPAVGMLIPVRSKKIDLGIRFYTMPMGLSHPEQPLLKRGGYSFLGARVALMF